MEGTSMSWVMGLVSLAAGVGLGALLTRPLLLKKQTEKSNSLQHQLDTLEQQQREYRQKVDQHFNQSADLFLEMTDNYRRIYQHLSSGAQNLCENPPKQLSNAVEGSYLVASSPEQLAHEPQTAPPADQPQEVMQMSPDNQFDSGTESEMDNTEAPATTAANGQREPATLH